MILIHIIYHTVISKLFIIIRLLSLIFFTFTYLIISISTEGNPVTGEGYKAGANDFHQRQESSNGGTPVINKNRIPPGGYSSGLW